ncbi:MAG: CRISPR-associated endoribonuclease Cas6 [Rhodothermales bacterium]
MRLHLKLTGNTQPVPFDHLHWLTGRLNRWLVDNDMHDQTSLYSFGWLEGGKPRNGALHFPRGASWRISFYDDAVSKRLIAGILKDQEVLQGMRVFEVQEQATPQFGGCVRFKTDGGPILARQKRDDGTTEHLLYDNTDADAALTRVLRWKLKKAGFGPEHLDAEVQFDRTYQRARTKQCTIKGIKYKASECPVVVTGSPEAVQFAWLVGIGELTGSGFGALR